MVVGEDGGWRSRCRVVMVECEVKDERDEDQESRALMHRHVPRAPHFFAHIQLNFDFD